jgi:hypothetical protein
MTVAEARRVFSSRPPFDDPKTKEAATVLGEIASAKKLIVSHFGGRDVVARPTPGSAFDKRLKKFQADVVDAAYAELGAE